MLNLKECDTDVQGQKRFSFSNVKTAATFEDGRIFLIRSAQPGYNGNNDTPHSIGVSGMTWLRHSRIGAVISANHCDLSAASRDRLAADNIRFMHCRVEDFHAPSVAHLLGAAALIESMRRQNKSALVYCGAGCGRTGTYIATWALKYHADAMGSNPAEVRAGCDAKGFDQALAGIFGVENEAQADAVYAAVTDNAPAAVIPAAPPPPVAGVNLPTALVGGNPGAAFANFNAGDGDEPAPPPGYGMPDF